VCVDIGHLHCARGVVRTGDVHHLLTCHLQHTCVSGDSQRTVQLRHLHTTPWQPWLHVVLLFIDFG
jgi:hypothetical protein